MKKLFLVSIFTLLIVLTTVSSYDYRTTGCWNGIACYNHTIFISGSPTMFDGNATDGETGDAHDWSGSGSELIYNKSAGLNNSFAVAQKFNTGGTDATLTLQYEITREVSFEFWYYDNDESTQKLTGFVKTGSGSAGQIYQNGDGNFKWYWDGGNQLQDLGVEGSHSWHHFRVIFNPSTAWSVSVDGGAWNNYTTAVEADLDSFRFYTEASAVTDNHKITAFRMWNGSWTNEPRHPPSGPTPPVLTFVEQNPTDLNIYNAMSRPLWVTYNITADAGVDAGTVISYYTINQSGTNEPRVFVNGTSTPQPRKKAGSLESGDIFNFSFHDNDVYPASYLFDEEAFEDEDHLVQSHAQQTEGGRAKFFNMSNTANNSIFEIMINSTDTVNLDVFYCNNSYTTGDPQTSGSCTQFFTLDPSTPFNHTHSDKSAHVLIPFLIINNSVNGIFVSKTGSFAWFPSANGGTWDAHYIANLSNTATSLVSNNKGSSWTAISGTWDAHIHQIENESFIYRMCANDTTGKESCADARTDKINLGQIPPSSPIVITPNKQVGVIGGNYSITYTKSQSISSAIDHYNISLHNPNGDFVRALEDNNGLNLNWTWDTTLEPDDNYTIKVTAVDINGLSAFDFSDEITVDNTKPTLTIIEPPNSQIYRNDSVRMSYICTDANLFGFETTISNSSGVILHNTTVNLTTNTFQYNLTFDLSSYPDGDYKFSASCYDGHTANEITITSKDIKTGMDYIRVKDLLITSSQDSIISYYKKTDRISYTFDYVFDIPVTYTITSSKPIYHRENSKYNGHLVSGNLWLDTGKYEPLSIRRISDYEYQMDFYGSYFSFDSVGEINNETQVNDFEIRRNLSIDVLWDDQFPTDLSTFYNRTSLAFRFNYTNNEGNESICALQRNSINVSTGTFNIGFNNLTDSSIPDEFTGNYTYQIICDAYLNDYTASSSIKTIGFENLGRIEAEKSISMVLTEVMKLAFVVFLFLVHFIFIFMAFKFRVDTFAFIGGLLGVIASLTGLLMLTFILTGISMFFLIAYCMISTAFMLYLIPYERIDI